MPPSDVAKLSLLMKPLRRLLPYLRRHRRAYLLGLAIVVPATACAAVQPLLIGWMMDRLGAQSGSSRLVLGVAGILALAALLRAVKEPEPEKYAKRAR